MSENEHISTCSKCGSFTVAKTFACVCGNIDLPVPSFCEWEYVGSGYWKTECGKERYNGCFGKVTLLSDYEFCPFKGCGKPIRVKEDK